MFADPKFKEYSEEEILNFVQAVTKPNPQFPESVMTEEEARKYIYDQSHPQRPEGYPVGVFFAWQLEHNIEDGILKPTYETIRGITRRQPDDQDNERFLAMAGYEGWELPPYGVCDNVEQILARFSIAEIPDRKFCLGIAPVFKKDQPPRDGWRWHKWGPYLGTHKIEWEYLADEENIEYVLIYHIYEIRSE